MSKVVDNKAIYSFGEFRLDPLLLTHSGSAVPLSPQAIKTLYLLVSRAPATVEKEEIMRTVWPDTFVVESGLTRNISLIRKAIEERAGEGMYIETVPKRGYRFVAPLNLDAIAANDDTAGAATVEEATKPARRWAWWKWAGPGAALIVALGVWLLRPGPAVENSAEDPNLQIARHLLFKGRPDDVRKALQWFEKAAVANPKSATAFAGIAESQVALAGLASNDIDTMQHAKSAAEKAIQLNPKNAAALTALGTVRMYVDVDLVGAEKAFRDSYAIDPNLLMTNYRYASLLNAMGRFEESLRLATRACELDPVSPMLGLQKGLVYYAQRRFDEASREFAAVLERERDFTLAHYYQGLTLGFLLRFQEAEQHLSRTELNPAVLQSDRAWLRVLQGDRRAAEESLASTQQLVKDGKVSGMSTLLMTAWLGRLDEAFEAIDVGIREKNLMLLGLRSDPRITEKLAGDSRYGQALMRSGLQRTRP